MATTLVVNPGSSSKKYALYCNSKAVLTCRFERVGAGLELCTTIDGVQQKCSPLTESEYVDAISHVLSIARDRNLVTAANPIDRIGVRVVAPGTRFTEHTVIDEEFLDAAREQAALAPVHLPGALAEIDRIRALLPETLLVSVSDSAFHTTMPRHARHFSISQNDAARLDLYRFGYHGLSVASIVAKLPLHAGAIPERTIVCHVGSGVSVTALARGVSIDTTMGYAPGGGVIMSSRAGDLEPAALLSLMEADNLTVAEASTYLQTRGGLFGLAGESDLRIILKRYAEHDVQACAALDAFLYQLTSAIGAYVAALGGIDALVLTATAMERNPDLRRRLLERLTAFGFMIDSSRNDETIGREGCLSQIGLVPAVYVLHTDEMGEMARVTSTF